MNPCDHSLAERETMVADGYCPECMKADVRAREARLREAVERVMDAASEDNWCPPDRWKAIKAALGEAKG